jgi:hypothetical protein
VAQLREKVRRRAFLVRQNTKLKVKIRDVLVSRASSHRRGIAS